MIADRRLCLTADRSEIVEESDPRASWLLVAAGRQIGAGDVARYGLVMVDGRVVAGGQKQAAKPEDKMMAAPENKSAVGLPDDIPGREQLLAAGVLSLDDVAAMEDLTDVDGIGKATAAKILAYLEEASA